MPRVVSYLFVLIYFNFAGYSQIKLPKLISNGMVLQRDKKIKIWGWSGANEKIKLSFLSKEYLAKADDMGNWEIMLPSQKAGGPYEMHLRASNEIVLSDIYFGDVWLCSGQSNMEISMARVQDKYPDIVAKANNPRIRQFLVPDKYDFNAPAKDVESGEWKALNSNSVFEFSAVALFFAENLFEKYKVPIGLINSALGGSPVEAWISEDSLKKFPDEFEELQEFKDKNLITEIEAKDKLTNNNWYQTLNEKDKGVGNHWESPTVNDSSWAETKVPGYWADGSMGNINGSVWFRKKIIVPASMVGKPAKLLLGRIVDADSVYINGIFVGSTGYQYPPRRYLFSPDILKEGENTLTVRLINNSGRGGFVPDKPYELIVENSHLDLKGNWKFKLGAKMDPLSGQTFVRWKPGGLFNGMIAPLLKYKIKGVIWYQGEANTSKASTYTERFSTLIRDWRAGWGMGAFPFLFVQLPNFMETKSEPSESNWAALREAQRKTLALSNTGMVVAIDLGEWNDIHPLNKQDVGMRLALMARHLAYSEKNIVYSGPLLKTTMRQSNKIILNFYNSGSGLIYKSGNELKYFSIAGPDKHFIWAKASIVHNSVVVWSDKISNPVFVRYAWADNPEGANLYNKEGLPASPFEAKVE